jgi:hypothetical protein
MSIPSVATVSFNRQTMEAGKSEFVTGVDAGSMFRAASDTVTGWIESMALDGAWIRDEGALIPWRCWVLAARAHNGVSVVYDDPRALGCTPGRPGLVHAPEAPPWRCIRFAISLPCARI